MTRLALVQGLAVAAYEGKTQLAVFVVDDIASLTPEIVEEIRVAKYQPKEKS